MLGNWINDARSWAAIDAEKAYYEKNARTILTVWGGEGELIDYAGRQWNGLMRDYYLPRWQILVEATLAELKGGKSVDRAALEKKWREHEKTFAITTGSLYARQPGDSFAMSRKLFRKYSPENDDGR
jgi:alpha-N-acetylglucosaminidase